MAFLLNNLSRRFEALVDNRLHLLINQLWVRSVLRAYRIGFLSKRLHAVIIFLVVDISDLVAHTELDNHVTGHLVRLVEIVVGPGGDHPKEFLLGDPPSQNLADFVLELLLSVQRAFVGQVLRETEGALRPGNNGQFEQGVASGEEPRHYRVPGFVDRHCLPFLVCDYPLLLQTSDNPFHGHLEVVRVHGICVIPGCLDGGFVAD